MSHLLRDCAGFTILELALVLIVVGLLASALLPLAGDVHINSMNERDQATMESAKNALLGYVRVNSGLPCVDDTGDPDVTTGCDATNTLDLLGVRTTDARGRTFAYDVNSSLTVFSTGGNWTQLCTALTNLINAGGPQDPSTCATSNANTGNTACTASHSLAYVLVGRGSDRCLNLENTHATSPNDAVCATAVANNRTFENPVRRHSRDVDDGYYDDLVVTLTPAELAEAMGCLPGGGNLYAVCNAGERYLQITNGDNSPMGVSLDGGTTCDTVGNYGTRIFGCIDETTTVHVDPSTGNCGSGSPEYQAQVSDIDANGDGHADLFCTDPGPLSCDPN
ncbi:MAG: hypothetical protein RPU64_13410 [Candidatus Sedimenticola sp. (ex Thyasira tokunagai)]